MHNKNRKDWLLTPSEGQRFTDESGKHWHVRAVIKSPSADGFYIVRVAFGATPDCAEGISLLGRGEFGRLCQEMNLRPAPHEAVTHDGEEREDQPIV
jgi:hypothetical protein